MRLALGRLGPQAASSPGGPGSRAGAAQTGPQRHSRFARDGEVLVEHVPAPNRTASDAQRELAAERAARKRPNRPSQMPRPPSPACRRRWRGRSRPSVRRGKPSRNGRPRWGRCVPTCGALRLSGTRCRRPRPTWRDGPSRGGSRQCPSPMRRSPCGGGWPARSRETEARIAAKAGTGGCPVLAEPRRHSSRRVVLPHWGMLPREHAVASLECSRGLVGFPFKYDQSSSCCCGCAGEVVGNALALSINPPARIRPERHRPRRLTWPHPPHHRPQQNALGSKLGEVTHQPLGAFQARQCELTTLVSLGLHPVVSLGVM